MKRLLASVLMTAVLLTGCGTEQLAVDTATTAADTVATMAATTTTTTTTAEMTTTAAATTAAVTTSTTTVTTRPLPQAVPQFPQWEAEVLRLMNEHRAVAGVKPLTMRYEYYDCAETRVRECLILWSHTRPDGRKSNTVYLDFGLQDGLRLAGENLAKGFSTPEAMVEGLMASPGHRKNILHEEYDSVVISIVEMDGEEGRYAMSQLFMAMKEEECV